MRQKSHQGGEQKSAGSATRMRVGVGSAGLEPSVFELLSVLFRWDRS